MNEAPRLGIRKRSSGSGDLAIILLGIWGFIRQCLRSMLGAGRAHELDSED